MTATKTGFGRVRVGGEGLVPAHTLGKPMGQSPLGAAGSTGSNDKIGILTPRSVRHCSFLVSFSGFSPRSIVTKVVTRKLGLYPNNLTSLTGKACLVLNDSMIDGLQQSPISNPEKNHQPWKWDSLTSWINCPLPGAEWRQPPLPEPTWSITRVGRGLWEKGRAASGVQWAVRKRCPLPLWLLCLFLSRANVNSSHLLIIDPVALSKAQA